MHSRSEFNKAVVFIVGENSEIMRSGILVNTIGEEEVELRLTK